MVSARGKAVMQLSTGCVVRLAQTTLGGQFQALAVVVPAELIARLVGHALSFPTVIAAVNSLDDAVHAVLVSLIGHRSSAPESSGSAELLFQRHLHHLHKQASSLIWLGAEQ